LRSKKKSPLNILTTNLEQEFESLRARHIATIQKKIRTPGCRDVINLDGFPIPVLKQTLNAG
jgi:hypothetical protein